MTKPDENGTAGADATHQTMLVVKLDLETFQVAIGGDVMPMELVSTLASVTASKCSLTYQSPQP